MTSVDEVSRPFPTMYCAASIVIDVTVPTRRIVESDRNAGHLSGNSSPKGTNNKVLANDCAHMFGTSSRSLKGTRKISRGTTRPLDRRVTRINVVK